MTPKIKCSNVQFQKISILPPRKVFHFAPPLPHGYSSLASYFASKILAVESPLPLEISDDLPWWGGGGFFSGTVQSRLSNVYYYKVDVIVKQAAE